MLRAFRWNLRVLSYISLVVGAFLIYNTIAMSVVRRRAEIGVLRALGAGRVDRLRGCFWRKRCSWASRARRWECAGTAAGRRDGAVDRGHRERALYHQPAGAGGSLPWAKLGLGIFLGALAALVSALAPAREAMGVRPAEAMGRGAHEHHARLRWRRGLAWAGSAGAAALACVAGRAVRGYPVGGYAAALLAVAPWLGRARRCAGGNYATPELFHKRAESHAGGAEPGWARCHALRWWWRRWPRRSP